MLSLILSWNIQYRIKENLFQVQVHNKLQIKRMHRIYRGKYRNTLIIIAIGKSGQYITGILLVCPTSTTYDNKVPGMWKNIL